jgi:sterol desaturase/sphingolipid hydroxylase (fatty acid hydroxylase superfamily)
LTLGFALLLTAKPLGMLYQVHWPWSIKCILGIFALDLVMYTQHRALHYVPWLWRLHRVHHMDRHLDVTTALRFHPLEALFTTGSQILGVAFFGIDPLAVIIYQLLLGLFLFFAHMNVRLSMKTDLILRTLLVTPHMHRIHHSDEPSEHNRNYGFCLSIWDRLIGSYRGQVAAGYYKVVFGVVGYQDPKYQLFVNMLLVPFNTQALIVHPPKRFITQYAIAPAVAPSKLTQQSPMKRWFRKKQDK